MNKHGKLYSSYFDKHKFKLVYKGKMITGLKPSKKTWKICTVFKDNKK